MKKVKDLVPKNKFDFSGIEELRKLSDEEIASVIPDLLAWLKDMNWPVAKEMPALLALLEKPDLSAISDIFIVVFTSSFCAYNIFSFKINVEYGVCSWLINTFER